jgi:hypothetical protein
MNKNTFTLSLIIFLIVLSSCMRREYVLEYDYDYKGNFKKYSSFNFMRNAKIDQDSAELAYKPLLEEAIKNRMEILGYKLSEDKPRLLVAYSIFYDNMKFRGYLQPELEKWVEKATDEDAYDPVKLELKEGTVLVQLIDTKKNNTVWQGYASGVFGYSYANNERHIKRAVRSIFDQYRIMAEGFDINQKNLVSNEP